MVGAVVRQELLIGGRRFPLHAMRWVYAAWLILQVLYLLLAFQVEMGSRPPGRADAPTSVAEVVGGRFAESFVRQQVLLLLLLTPAFVAGSITDEKRKGTLQHLLLTEMEPRHLILGKLAGRVLQVLMVLMAGLPLFALLAGLGGVAPATMFFVGASLVMPLIGLASMTVLASVWCRQTRDAVLALYVVLLAGAGVVYWLGGAARLMNPLYVIEPAWAPPGSIDVAEAGRRLLAGGAAWGVIAAACLTVAAWRLGPAYAAQIENSGKRAAEWFSEEREPITEEPVEWRERHVEGLSPHPMFRKIASWQVLALIALASTASSLFLLWRSMAPRSTLSELCRAMLALNTREVAALMPEAHIGFLIQSVVVMLLFSLVVGIRCSGAITGEREARTWEALLLTPQTAKQIIHGKLWGVMSASYAYLLAYAAPALALSVLAGPLGFAHTLLWFAVTVLMMYFIGAAGLWCSVRAPNSWRALLNTVLVGYVGGLAIYAITTPVIGILVGMLILALFFVDLIALTSLAPLCLQNQAALLQVFWVSSAVGLAILFFLLARLFLDRALRWVADRDRTRHWHEEPYYRRSRDVSMGEAE